MVAPAHVNQLAVDDVGHAAAPSWRAALRGAQHSFTGIGWVVRLAEASQAEHAFDGPARPHCQHAALWWFIGTLKPHMPDGLSAGEVAGIIGDLGPASAYLVLGKDKPVALGGWFHADGGARCGETLTEFPGEVFGCEQQGCHQMKPTVL